MAANDLYNDSQTVIPGACPHHCPDRCSWLMTVKDDQAVKLVGHPEQPVAQGVLCAKVSHSLKRVYSPQCPLYPLKRVAAKGEAPQRPRRRRGLARHTGGGGTGEVRADSPPSGN